MIVEGKLAPGEKINEAALARQFGISRTPLRESLKVLAADGLVEIQPNRGAWVAKWSTADLEPIYQVIAVLEGLGGELAAKAITEEELHEIRVLQVAMEAAFARHDQHNYFILNQQIHEAILVASKNPVLISSHHMLSMRLIASRFQATLSQRRWAEAMSEHQVILGLLELRRGEQLGSVLRAHIMKNVETLKSMEMVGQAGVAGAIV